MDDKRRRRKEAKSAMGKSDDGKYNIKQRTMNAPEKEEGMEADRERQ